MTNTTQTQAREPQALHRLFEAFANAGDLDGLMSIYEPQVTAVPQPGQVVRGVQPLRDELGGLLAMGPTFHLQTLKVLRSDDIALLCNRWTATAEGPDGKEVHLGGVSAEVARRQPDGTWFIVVDDPNFVE